MKKNEDAKQATRERDELGFWKVDKPFRLDVPLSPEAYQQLPWLSEEEKSIGIGLLEKILEGQRYSGLGKGNLVALDRIYYTQATACVLNDPELQAAYFPFFEQMVTLVTGLDGNTELMQATTHSNGVAATSKSDNPDIYRRVANALLSLFAMAAERNDLYFTRFMTSVPMMQNDPDPQTGLLLISAEKASQILNPESSVWNDEQRLVLQLTYAAMRREMTNALWDRCMAMWGPKETMRYVLWVGQYDYLCMLNGVFDLRSNEL
ncbi:MAG: hypothetical protein HKP58_10680 [Desulfatitalea sp.]|nr:hypothetical protein [Desulfatitalea sp.]NNK00865.1 hypothetical protein [Desulfatitalea sp.]